MVEHSATRHPGVRAQSAPRPRRRERLGPHVSWSPVLSTHRTHTDPFFDPFFEQISDVNCAFVRSYILHPKLFLPSPPAPTLR